MYERKALKAVGKSLSAAGAVMNRWLKDLLAAANSYSASVNAASFPGLKHVSAVVRGLRDSGSTHCSENSVFCWSSLNTGGAGFAPARAPRPTYDSVPPILQVAGVSSRTAT